MRKIKFRMWEMATREWVTSPEAISDAIAFEIEDIFTLEQFTGVQDKEGTDIYEGDIVEFAHRAFKAEVKYKDTAFMLVYLNQNARSKLIGSRTEPIPLNVSISCKVVGNIHEENHEG